MVISISDGNENGIAMENANGNGNSHSNEDGNVWDPHVLISLIQRQSQP